MNYQIRKLINEAFSVEKLLNMVGISVSGTQSIHCPFHPDSRKSAAFYADSNEIYCFAESKTFRAYDLLKKVMRLKDQEIIKHLHRMNIRPQVKRTVEKSLFRVETLKYLEALRGGFIKRQYLPEDYASCIERCMDMLE